MNALWEKLKESIRSVLPIAIIVLIMNFTLSPLTQTTLTAFLIGAVLVMLGLAIFLLGVDLGLTPIGEHLGKGIAQSNKTWVLILSGIVLGFIISIAEPDLMVLANQVEMVSSGRLPKMLLLIIVSLGIALLLTLGLVRIVKGWSVKKLFIGIYGIIFLLSLFVPADFLAISFDASGATTGALAVPFFLALSLSISALEKNTIASENDSFGLVGITSTGAILAVLLMTIITKQGTMSGANQLDLTPPTSVLFEFAHRLPHIIKELVIALTPILLVFLRANRMIFHLKKRRLYRILFGIFLTLLGLVLFMLGVQAGFMQVGSIIGNNLVHHGPWVVISVAFLIGLVTILAEPAVYVLIHQIEDVTSGSVSKRPVLVSLALGVGLAVTLSIVRILIPSIQLWHFLLPGFLISLALTFFVPDFFVGMAFDSGGVASGPMTATFVLAFAQGVAHAIPTANVLVDGFGIIALVAMTPIIALQILGLIYQRKLKKEI